MAGPSIRIRSLDDGINASSKNDTVYVYADDSEEQYTKTSTSTTDNVFNMYSGYVNVMIADDDSHSITLPVAGEADATYSYTADGDGIDCNGSFYAYSGTVVVFGTTSGDNSPIDTDKTYYIGSGVTLLAVGSNGMIENPTQADQAYVTTGSSGGNGGMFGRQASNNAGGFGGNGGPGGNGEPGGNGGPGSNGGSGSSNTYDADTAFGIADSEGNILLSICPNKAYGYVLYSSPELSENASHTMYSGGSVSGDKLTDSDGDFRYAGYDTSAAEVVSTVTAQK